MFMSHIVNLSNNTTAIFILLLHATRSLESGNSVFKARNYLAVSLRSHARDDGSRRGTATVLTRRVRDPSRIAASVCVIQPAQYSPTQDDRVPSRRGILSGPNANP